MLLIPKSGQRPEDILAAMAASGINVAHYTADTEDIYFSLPRKHPRRKPYRTLRELASEKFQGRRSLAYLYDNVDAQGLGIGGEWEHTSEGHKAIALAEVLLGTYTKPLTDYAEELAELASGPLEDAAYFEALQALNDRYLTLTSWEAARKTCAVHGKGLLYHGVTYGGFCPGCSPLAFRMVRDPEVRKLLAVIQHLSPEERRTISSLFGFTKEVKVQAVGS